MSDLTHALLIVVIVGLAVVRQFMARPVSPSRGWWIVPAVLAYLAVSRPGLIDTAHESQAATLFVAELLAGVGAGAAWAWTSRVWADPSGSVWWKGTKITMIAWLGSIALRASLYAVGTAMNIRSTTGSLLLTIAVALLVRSVILIWRAQALKPTAYRVPVAD